MASKKVIGKCHICRQEGPLTFEHLPPESAFNDKPVVLAKFDANFNLGPDDPINGTVQQRGMGEYTLCGKCNNDAGHWYGSQFVDWCYQGMGILTQSQGKPVGLYINHLSPLPVLKQIVTMFFSVNEPGICSNDEELVRFILNKEAKYLPPKYRFFVYYSIRGRMRMAGLAAIFNTYTGKHTVMSEFNFPPYGYVMTFDNTSPPDGRVMEITHFSEYDYSEVIDLPIQLPELPAYSPFPGDYREKTQIYLESAISKVKADRFLNRS